MAPEVLEDRPHGKSIDWYQTGALLYEMLYSMPPYITTDPDKIYESIKRAPLNLPPSNCSPECRDLLFKLLCKNPYSRLGARDGFEEIKNHPWFSTIEWDDLLKKRIQPKIYKIKDLKDRRNEIKMDSMIDHPNQQPPRFRNHQLKHMPNWSFYNESVWSNVINVPK